MGWGGEGVVRWGGEMMLPLKCLRQVVLLGVALLVRSNLKKGLWGGPELALRAKGMEQEAMVRPTIHTPTCGHRNLQKRAVECCRCCEQQTACTL